MRNWNTPIRQLAGLAFHPPRLRSLFRYGLAPRWTQRLGARMAALCPSELAEGHGGRIARVDRLDRERSAIKLFSDSLLNYTPRN